MTTKELAAAIREKLGVKARTKIAATGSFGVFDLCCFRAQDGQLPYAVYTAAYGIAWAMQTGRLDASLSVAIRDMPARTATALVAAVAVACESIGEVPGWLMANREAVIAR